MVPGLGIVIFVSSVTLALAQFPARQQQSLSHLFPVQLGGIPNSQEFMTQSANVILNQDSSIPITTGFLSGPPVQVNEAAESILSQEAKVIGYNGPSGFLFQQGPTQSIRIPVLNHVQRRPVNAVPVRTVTSYQPTKSAESLSYGIVKKPYSSKLNYARTEDPTSSKTRNKVYYDIPLDHPVPALETAQRDGSRLRGVEYRESAQEIRSNLPISSQGDNDIKGMRPPPAAQRDDPRARGVEYRQSSHEIGSNLPISSQNDYVIKGMRPPPPLIPSNEEQYSRTRSQNYRREPNSRETTHRQTVSKPELLRESVGKLLRVEEKKEARQSDSASQSSESFYQRSSQPSHFSGYSGGGGYSGGSRGIVHKHVFVHAAPLPQEYSYTPKVRIIRPAMEPEKHVQLIFVKTPSPPPQPQTIVELPEPPKQQTKVYILSKKPDEGHNDVKIIKPPPTKPSAPEIYFIRYGDRRANQGYPVANLQSLYDNYGAFSQPSEESRRPGQPLRSKRNKNGLGTYAPLNAHTTSGQINEISQEEAEFRRTNLDAFF